MHTLTFTNQQNHGKPDFQEYLKAPGYSHSFLKNNINGTMPFVPTTDKMHFGTLVDAILCNTGADMSHPQYRIACKVAAHITNHVPWLTSALSQQHMTATVNYVGLSLPIRSLPDFYVQGLATVDLKVSDIHSKNAAKHIAHMQWENQVFMQRGCANVERGYVLLYCLKDKQIVFTRVHGGIEWMGDMVLNFGTAL